MYTFYHSWGDYGILDSIRTGQSILSGQELGGKEEGRREKTAEEKPRGNRLGMVSPCRLRKMDFLNIPGKTVSAGRNRPRFAIRAHGGLLVTSVSPNCCFLNGILRKSHFSTQGNGETISSQFSRCPAPALILPPLFLPFQPLARRN